LKDKLQPHNIEAEEAVLGSLLIDPDAIIAISVILKPEDFYIERHEWIYTAMLELFEKNQPVGDLVTLSDVLGKRNQLNEIGGLAYLSDLITATPTSINARYYAGIIIENSTRRKYIRAASEIARLAYDPKVPVTELATKADNAIFRATPQDESQIRSLSQLASEELDRQEKIQEVGGELGVRTGLVDLDKLLGGIQATDVVIISGHPGMGKTALAINTIAMNVAREQHKKVGIVSLEMSGNQLVQRVIAAESGSLSTVKLRIGLKYDDDWKAFFEAIKNLEIPIYVDDSPAITTQQLRSKAKRMVAEYEIDLLIVDYLQLIDANINSDNENVQMAYISKTMKWIARELRIPVVAISNLRKIGNKEPTNTDLYGSTFLQYDASHILFVHRDEVINPDTEFPDIGKIILSKHRHGPTGEVAVFFKKKQQIFLDLEAEKTPLEY
jgi:replicative DNA helicase